VRHASARALAARHYYRIGAVVPTLKNATFAAGIEALQRRIDSEGYTLAVSSSEYDPDMESYQTRTLIEAGIDGLMLVGVSHPRSLYAMLREQGIPFIHTYVNWSPTGYSGAVGFNNRQGGKMVTQFLLDLGHQRIAMIAAPTKGNDRSLDRLEGVCEKLNKHGLDLPANHVIESPYSMREGRLAMQVLMQLKPQPTAIVCGNDSIAFGALAEIRSQGLNVPQDISLISFGDLEFAALLDPPLTTLRIPFADVGIRAAEYLLAKIQGKPIHDIITLDTDLIVRGTTAPPLA
jgi:LacI family transcriptional regulator